MTSSIDETIVQNEAGRRQSLRPAGQNVMLRDILPRVVDVKPDYSCGDQAGGHRAGIDQRLEASDLRHNLLVPDAIPPYGQSIVIEEKLIVFVSRQLATVHQQGG